MDLNQRLFGFCLLLLSFLVGGGLQAQSGNSAGIPKFIPSREAVEVISTARQGDDLEHPQALLPPGNDNCASAATLTVGAACVTGTTSTASTQVGEYLCINPGGGITPENVWYRFTATSTSMVLGVVLTNTSNCATVLAVYGPFASGGGCLPGAGNQLLCQNMGLIDPGFHPLLSGLTIGQDYLVQVQGNNCGGGSDRFANFCISINTPSANQSAGGASIINNCGTAFTGGTTGAGSATLAAVSISRSQSPSFASKACPPLWPVFAIWEAMKVSRAAECLQRYATGQEQSGSTVHASFTVRKRMSVS